jgi:hypothetical protein
MQPLGQFVPDGALLQTLVSPLCRRSIQHTGHREALHRQPRGQ